MLVQTIASSYLKHFIQWENFVSEVETWLEISANADFWRIPFSIVIVVETLTEYSADFASFVQKLVRIFNAVQQHNKKVLSDRNSSRISASSTRLVNLITHDCLQMLAMRDMDKAVHVVLKILDLKAFAAAFKALLEQENHSKPSNVLISYYTVYQEIKTILQR